MLVAIPPAIIQGQSSLPSSSRNLTTSRRSIAACLKYTVCVHVFSNGEMKTPYLVRSYVYLSGEMGD